jgi:hypothetical protein
MSSRRRLALGAWIPAVLWMGLIIWFSSERWSTERTGPVVTSVVSLTSHGARLLRTVRDLA